MYMCMIEVLEPVNRLPSSPVDRTTHTPAYKELSVNMTVLEERGSNPLLRRNFRNGTRTPTMGVEVERKRARADYHVPGTKAHEKLVQIESMKPGGSRG